MTNRDFARVRSGEAITAGRANWWRHSRLTLVLAVLCCRGAEATAILATDYPVCRENRSDPEQGLAVQGRFVHAEVAKKQNRVRLPNTFVAVLLTAVNEAEGL